MNRISHAWIAIRAIRLLEETGNVPGLVKLLKPFTREASIGAWLPDDRDAKIGGSKTQNHVFKIGPYSGNLQERFVLPKNKLLNTLGKDRLMYDYIKSDTTLDASWWSMPYKADPPAGVHLANRAMALTINNIDLLLLGDSSVQNLTCCNPGFISDVNDKLRCPAGEIAIFFFMLSHFIADSLMPCHCDERDLSDYSNGLHNELEEYWGKLAGNYFDKTNLCTNTLKIEDILNKAKSVDDSYGISFSNNIPDLNSDDIWEEIVMLCRASFVIASIMANPEDFPYKPKPQKKATFSNLFPNPKSSDSLSQLNKVVMHDSVLNVAMVWKNIWEKVNK